MHQKTHDGEKTTSSTNVAGKKMGICLQKTDTRPMSFTLYKYQLKMDKDLNVRPETSKQV
jgi:hypothetical protein